MNKDSKIKGVIFDYGGTIDTDAVHWAEVIWNAYLNYGADIDKDTFRMAYVHAERSLAKFPIIRPQDNFLQLLRHKINIQTSFLVDAHLWKRFENNEHERTIFSLNVAQFCYDLVCKHLKVSRKILTTIKRDFPMVLVSNFYGNIHAILDDFKLNCFDDVIESAVVGVRKPNPEIFRLGVNALGMSTEKVVVVGDSFDKDIIPANSIGCKTIWMKGTEWNPNVLHDESIPDKIISSISQVKEAIAEINK